jgi:hypothetical protein
MIRFINALFYNLSFTINYSAITNLLTSQITLTRSILILVLRCISLYSVVLCCTLLYSVVLC